MSYDAIFEIPSLVTTFPAALQRHEVEEIIFQRQLAYSNLIIINIKCLWDGASEISNEIISIFTFL